MADSRTLLDERISALMDGAMHAQECAGAVQRVLADPDGLRVWHSYHVVGDALRSAELASAGSDHAFWEKLSHTLAQEPGRPEWGTGGVMNPSAVDQSSLTLVPEMPRNPIRVAANAPVWRRKLLVGAACSALVAVVGLGLRSQTETLGGQQLATQATPQATQELAVVEGDGGVMLRDPNLDALMAAHQQLGGHSALQAPSGFLRNATYQGPAR